MRNHVMQRSNNTGPENVLLILLVLYLIFQVGVISLAAFKPDLLAPWVCVAMESEPRQKNGSDQVNDDGEAASGDKCLIPVDVNLGLGFTVAAFWLASIVQVRAGSGAPVANFAVGFAKFAAPALAVYLAIWLGLQSATLWFGLMIAFGFVLFGLIYILTSAMGLFWGAANAVGWLIARLRQPARTDISAAEETAVAATTPLDAMEQIAGPRIAAYPERVAAVEIWSAIEELYEILVGLPDQAGLNGIGYLWSACGLLNVVYAHRDAPLPMRLTAVWQANYCVTSIVPVVGQDRNSVKSREAYRLVQRINEGFNSLSAALYRLERPS